MGVSFGQLTREYVIPKNKFLPVYQFHILYPSLIHKHQQVRHE